MLKSEVIKALAEGNRTFYAKVSDRRVRVRLGSESRYEGWNATNPLHRPGDPHQVRRTAARGGNSHGGRPVMTSTKTEDRRVHASDAAYEVVRYDRAGKWYLEAKDGSSRGHISLSEAIRFAMDLQSSGGMIHFRRPGGTTFDARVKRLMAGGKGIR